MKFSEFFLFTFIAFLASSASAQWNSNTSINTAVATFTKIQQNTHSVTDKKNGVIIGWDDTRNITTGSTDIYAQRLNSGGVAKWISNGVSVCTNTNTQRSVSITEDGNGGAILVWEDDRSGNYDIYAQKIDSMGNPLWTVDGVIITNSSTNQKNPKIINDNAGGAIIVWEDSVNFYFDIYAQRINSAGTVQWTTNGIVICNAPNTQNNPKIDIDGFGGGIITWQDKRTNIDYDIFAQRINSVGTVLWSANGVVICNAVNIQNNPRIEPDGSGGAVIAWVDKRGSLDYDIYAQRINSGGSVQWTPNGVAVCNSVNNQSAMDIKYIGSAGVCMSWKDQRSGSSDIYTQIISLTGTNVMTLNGVKLSNALKSLNPNNISDGAGGVIVAWEDSTAATGWDITSQKINSAGILQWSTGGIVVTNAMDYQINVSQVSDGFGGAIYVWEDHRNTFDRDVFAQHISTNGIPLGINNLFDFSSNQISFYPNPASNSATLKLSDRSIRDFKILIYNSFGEQVMEEERQNTDAANLQFSGFNSGIYHYSIFDKEKTVNYKGTFILEK